VGGQIEVGTLLQETDRVRRLSILCAGSASSIGVRCQRVSEWCASGGLAGQMVGGGLFALRRVEQTHVFVQTPVAAPV